MNHRSLMLLLVGLLLGGTARVCPAATTTPAAGDQTSADEALTRRGLGNGRIISLPAPLHGAEGRTARVLVPFADGVVTLALHRHSNRAEGFRILADTGDDRLVEVPLMPIETYRGFVEGDPDSRVAVSIDPGGVAGRVRLGDGREFWIERAVEDPDDPGGRRHVVYQTADILPTGARCGVPDGPMAPPVAADPMGPPRDPDLHRMGGLCNAQILIDCDFPFFQRMGSNLATLGRRVELVLNTVNLQYNNEVGIDHRLTAIIVRTDAASDPYVGNAMCDAGTDGLEDQVCAIWTPETLPSIERDMAHLFTGRVSGGTIGCNFIGVVCSEDACGASAIDYNNNLATSTDLLAHELGHGWGGLHCDCASPAYTMNAFATGANRFNPTLTIPTLVAYRNDNDDCLDCDGAFTVGCGNGSVNDCFAESAFGEPHCRDEACCIVMCAIDPFCCTGEWDATCASGARSICAGCGEPGSGSPFEPNGTPGCSDAFCCEIICGTDPFCCSTEWDEECADDALVACGGCGDASGSSPYEEHFGGTSDAECCATICVDDPFCCLTEWDVLCTREAMQVCASCGDAASGSAFVVNGSRGCDALDCCETVCPLDPFCCETGWDIQCASRAALECPGWCRGDLDFDGQVLGDDLGLLVAQWGSTSTTFADLNDDGVVDGADFGIFLGNWGGCGY